MTPDRTTTFERTSDETTAVFDVAIVGAGPAGCAAGVFCSRAGLETVAFTDGRSTLSKNVYVENYLGFPAGVKPDELLELCREHVRMTGCTLQKATVRDVRQIPDGFELRLDDGSVAAGQLIVASWAQSEYLDGLGVETVPEEDGPVEEVPTDHDGRTNVDGVWAAGRITGGHHQALVSAGEGARVALNLIDEAIPDFYNDWIAPEGYYARYDKDIPVGVEEIDHEERQKRASEGRAWMYSFFDPDTC